MSGQAAAGRGAPAPAAAPAAAAGGLTGEILVEDMTGDERARAVRVEGVLDTLAASATEADRSGEFPLSHVRTLSEAGLLGLNVPARYGGLGGGLRDLAAATFAMATSCASTSIAYFFQCSGTSRGLLPLAAIDAGLFDPEEVPAVRGFAEKVLRRMGAEGRWVANFASESVRVKDAAIAIATEASPAGGGWLVNGVKSFGCATGVADDYLVTARLPGGSTAEHLGVFLIPRDSAGVSNRTRWDALGMRASATHGIVLEDVFVPADCALSVPGAFVRMTQVSRGSFVGNQVALSSVYLGAAHAVTEFALNHLRTTTYHGTDEPIGAGALHKQLIGRMQASMQTALGWARRQLQLETSDPPLMSKEAEVAHWRIAKGEIAENCFDVAVTALKACGTGNTGFGSPISRGLRDIAMALVQGFPPERGRLDAAEFLVHGAEGARFGAAT
ncbi:MAG: acyl-CoA dehydrogenase family protein [bacterium]|nr:acyl-CoA dehydrogenase family protein [bacterium]